MTFDTLRSPVAFLSRMFGGAPIEAILREYESWWEAEGKAISENAEPLFRDLAIFTAETLARR